MSETISSVMGIIPNLNTNSPTEIIEWLEIVTAALLQLKEELRKNYLLINSNLRAKIMATEVLSYFESVSILSDRIGALKVYGSKKFSNVVKKEAEDYCQGANDVLVYFNHKLSKLKKAKPDLDPIEYIDGFSKRRILRIKRKSVIKLLRPREY